MASKKDIYREMDIAQSRRSNAILNAGKAELRAIDEAISTREKFITERVLSKINRIAGIKTGKSLHVSFEGNTYCDLQFDPKADRELKALTARRLAIATDANKANAKINAEHQALRRDVALAVKLDADLLARVRTFCEAK